MHATEPSEPEPDEELEPELDELEVDRSPELELDELPELELVVPELEADRAPPELEELAGNPEDEPSTLPEFEPELDVDVAPLSAGPSGAAGSVLKLPGPSGGPEHAVAMRTSAPSPEGPSDRMRICPW